MAKKNDDSLMSLFDETPKQSAKDKALDRFAEYMIDKIQTLQTDWKKPWFTDAPACMPMNMDGRQYNGMNAFMLLIHCEKEGYKTPIFVTYDKVMSLNYKKDKQGKRQRITDKDNNELPFVTVKKDEHSFPVFLTTFYIKHKDTGERITMDEYKTKSSEEQKDYKVYPNQSVYYVFNIDQTNMSEARPDLYKKLTRQDKKESTHVIENEFVFPAFDDMVETNNWYCPITLKHQDGAFYSPSKDSITLPEKFQFFNGEAFYATAIHEVAHSTGHADRLNREGVVGKHKFGSAEYGKEELIAEMTSALVCHTYGFDNGIQEESAAYIKGWLKNIKEDVSFLKDVLNDVRKAYQMITNRIEKIA